MGAIYFTYTPTHTHPVFLTDSLDFPFYKVEKYIKINIGDWMK